MLKKLLVVLAVLALAAPAFAATVSKDGLATMDITVSGNDTSGRYALEFSTGGAWDYIGPLGGNASGWCYYQLHEYTNETGGDLLIAEYGYPTAENSGDPIPLPVEWVVALTASVFDIADPYTYAWNFSGDFMPTAPIDDPTVFSVIDVTGEGIVLPAGGTMVWGCENAGIINQDYFNGVVTYGWYSGIWESDEPWGRTGIQQFGAGAGTAALDASMGSVKALY